MRSAPLLVASETRSKIADLVAPLLEATIAGLDAEGQVLVRGRGGVEVNGTRYTCRTMALLQHAPCMLRLVLVGLPRRVELQRFDAAEIQGLEEAVEELLAGVLASLGDGADLAIAAAASQRAGGFIAWFDPVAGSIEVLVAKSGEDLAGAIEVGMIAPAPETKH